MLTSADFLLVRNFSVEVTAISVVHDDAEATLVHERLFVGDDVWVAHRFQHVNLHSTRINEITQFLPLTIYLAAKMAPRL